MRYPVHRGGLSLPSGATALDRVDQRSGNLAKRSLVCGSRAIRHSAVHHDRNDGSIQTTAPN